MYILYHILSHFKAKISLKNTNETHKIFTNDAHTTVGTSEDR